MHVQYTWSRIRALTVNDHSFDVEQATAETTFEKKTRHSGTNSQLNDQVCCPFTKLEMRRMLEVAYGMIRKYHGTLGTKFGTLLLGMRDLPAIFNEFFYKSSER